MSSLEIAASGLPLLVSNLQGLTETIEEGETGFLFTPGNHIELAKRIISLLDDEPLRNECGERARARIEAAYSRQHQVNNLVQVVQRIYSSG